MPRSYPISEYRKADAPAVRAILPEFLDEYSGLLARGSLLVARRGNRVVGFLFIRWFRERCYYDETVTRYAEIVEVHVHPEHRNRGIATALVRRALREAVRRSCAAVYLVTDDFNAAARRVYTKCGFSLHNHVIRYKRTLPRGGEGLTSA